VSNKLLFIYNANSSLLNQVGDLIHKSIYPKTYQCNLCGLTYSGVRMKTGWKDFISSLPIKSIFLHKNELPAQYPFLKNKALPAVFINRDGKFEELISSNEINNLKSLESLEKLVLNKIEHE